MINITSNSPLQYVPNDYSLKGAENKWFLISEGLDKGKKMFYYDYRSTNYQDKVVLFVHGNPECSYTYRHIRDEIYKNDDTIRIIAMDHIGFGISDRATYEMIDKHHAFNLRLLINHLDLKNILLVIHDWGGPIGIGALIDMPEKVNSLVLMNTTIFPMPKEGYTYQNYPYRILPWCYTPKIVPNALWGGLAAYIVPNASPQGFFTFTTNVIIRFWRHFRKTIDKNHVEYVWSQMFRDTQNALSSKRQVLQTPLWGHGYEYEDKNLGKVSNYQFYENMQASISQKWRKISVAGFFGQWDPCGKDEVINQWKVALPQIANHLYKYKDVGHFIEEVKGVEIGQKIVSMVREMD